jgi:tetratricopeptide (TPR) repeat protein
MKRIMLLITSLTLVMFTLQCGSGKKGSDSQRYSDQELLELAQRQYKAGDAQATVNTCERLLLEYPTSNLHIETQLLLSQAYGDIDQYEEQMNLLLRLLRENIIPEYSPQVYVQIGKFYERAARFNPGIITSDTTDYRLALDYYEKAILYPDSDDDYARSEAQYRRGIVEAKIGQINQAIVAYQKVVSNYPDSDFSLLAQVKLKNPRNTSELGTDQNSLNEYQNLLESPDAVIPEDTPEESTTPVEEDDASMDNLIEQTLETPTESTAPPETEEAAPPVEDRQIEEDTAPESVDPFSMPEETTTPADTTTMEEQPDSTGF